MRRELEFCKFVLTCEPLDELLRCDHSDDTSLAVLLRSALFNICRKALGHLMKFTQRSIPYRFRFAG